jgi:coproporphyrinogen III oxidase
MNPIKELMSTHTTSQMLYKLRKNYNDKDILNLSSEVSRGMYEAFSSIMNNQLVTSYGSEEREVTESEKDYYE